MEEEWVRKVNEQIREYETDKYYELHQSGYDPFELYYISDLFSQIDGMEDRTYYRKIGEIVNDDLVCYMLMKRYGTTMEELNSVRIEALTKKNVELMEKEYRKDTFLQKICESKWCLVENNILYERGNNPLLFLW